MEGWGWVDAERWKIALREKETKNKANKMLGDGMAIVNSVLKGKTLERYNGIEVVVRSGMDWRG